MISIGALSRENSEAALCLIDSVVLSLSADIVVPFGSCMKKLKSR
jgi:hypothetical protein